MVVTWWLQVGCGVDENSAVLPMYNTRAKCEAKGGAWYARATNRDQCLVYGKRCRPRTRCTATPCTSYPVHSTDLVHPVCGQARCASRTTGGRRR